MAQTNARRVLFIFGLSGSGKTLYARWYIRQFGRALILPLGADEQDYPGELAGTFWEARDLLQKRQDSLFRVRWVPTFQEFPLAVELVKIVGDCCFLVDEADRYLKMGRLDEGFLDLVARSRHWGKSDGVSLVVIGQNPMQIPIDVRRQFTEMVVFNTAEEADVDWLRKMMGREWGERARVLKDLHGIRCIRGRGCQEFEIDPNGGPTFGKLYAPTEVPAWEVPVRPGGDETYERPGLPGDAGEQADGGHGLRDGQRAVPELRGGARGAA